SRLSRPSASSRSPAGWRHRYSSGRCARPVSVARRAALLRPASSLSLPAFTALFNAGYEGYVIPFRVDEATVRWMLDSFDIDADASRVAYRSDDPVGFANLARRGDQAWVGGVGVVPSARRQGLGEQLMRAVHEEARSRGVATIRLEVIEQNEAAF